MSDHLPPSDWKSELDQRVSRLKWWLWIGASAVIAVSLMNIALIIWNWTP